MTKRYFLDELGQLPGRLLTSPAELRWVSHASRQEIRWECEKGHEFLTTPHALTVHKLICPACHGHIPAKGESLQDLFPEVAARIADLRGAPPADQLRPYSRRSLLFRCDAGHLHKARIQHMTAGRQCCQTCRTAKEKTPCQ